MDTKPIKPDALEPDEEPIRWLSIGAAIAAISSVGIALGLGLPLLTYILERDGISPELIGANSALAGLASLAVAPFCTPIARRYGVANTMLFCVVIASASAMGFYLVPEFWMWFPLRVSFHGAITVLFILSEFWINEAAPPARRGFVLGLYATVLSLGFAVGPLIFALIGSSGILPFVIGASIILIAAIPIVMARSQSPVLTTRPTVPFMRYLFIVPTATAAVFVFGAVESGGFALFPVYSNGIGFTEAQGAGLLTMIGLGNVLLQLPIGLLADRVKDRRILLLVFAFIGLAGSLLLPVVSSEWWTLAATLFLWGAVVAGLYTVGLAHLGNRLRGSELASANAAFIFSYSVGMMIGPQVLGISIGLFGTQGFAYGLAIFFGLYLLVTFGRMQSRPAR